LHLADQMQGGSTLCAC